MTRRLLAGLPVTALSPSLYLLTLPDPSRSVVETVIRFTGETWVMEWSPRGRATVRHPLTFPSAHACAQFLVDLGRGSVAL